MEFDQAKCESRLVTRPTEGRSSKATGCKLKQMRFILFFLTLTSTYTAHSQEPKISYRFRVFNKNNVEITDSIEAYKLKSLPLKAHLKTIDDTVIFSKYGHWIINQEFRNIRNYLWIQIIKTEQNDTMNVFLKKNSKYSFYPSEDKTDPNQFDGKIDQVDSIRFQKGNFIVIRRPKFSDWKQKLPGSIIKLSGRIETYLDNEFDQYGNKKN